MKDLTNFLEVNIENLDLIDRLYNLKILIKPKLEKIIEENLLSTWYTIQGDTTQYSFTGTTGTINLDAWDTVLEGEINITFYAQDSVGNIGIETVTVIKRIPSPPSIPGYNMYLLLAIFFIALIITLRGKHLNSAIKN